MSFTPRAPPAGPPEGAADGPVALSAGFMG